MSASLGTLTLDLIVKLGGFSAPLDQAARDADTKMARIEKSTNAASDALEGLAGKAKALGVAVGFGLSASEILKSVEAYTGLQNRLKLVTNSQFELANATKDVFNIAQATRSDLEATSTIYSNFAKQADRLGISQSQVALVTKTVSQAVALSGGSAESAAAAITQFGQSLASGVFRGDEFNSVAEQAPGLMKALSEGLGISSGALRKMAADGRLTADVLLNGLSKAAQQVQIDFEKTAPTISQAFGQINNAKIDFLGNQFSDSAKVFSGLLSGIAKHFNQIASAGEALAAGSIVYFFSKGALAVQANTVALIENRAVTLAALEADVVATAIKVTSTAAIAEHAAMQVADATATAARMSGLQRLTFVEATLLPLQNANTAALAANTAAAEANAVANSALSGASRGLLSVFMGPLGIAFAVAAVAAGFLLMGENADKAKPKLQDLGDTIDVLTTNVQALNEVQRDAVKLSIKETVAKDKSALSDITSQYISATNAASYYFGQNGDTKSRDEVNRLQLALKNNQITASQFNQELKKLNVPQDIIDKTTVIGNAWTNSANELQKYLDKADQFNKLDKSMAGVTDAMQDQIRKEKALQMQRDENGKGLKKLIQDNQEAAAKIKDPSFLGTAKRNIAQQQKTFEEGGESKVFNKPDLDAYYASESAKDRAKAQVEADKKAIESITKAQKESTQEIERQKKAYAELLTSQLDPLDEINQKYDKQIELIDKAVAGRLKATGSAENKTDNSEVRFKTKSFGTINFDPKVGGTFDDFIAKSGISDAQKQEALAGYQEYLAKKDTLFQKSTSAARNATFADGEKQKAIVNANRKADLDKKNESFTSQLNALKNWALSDRQLLDEKHTEDKQRINDSYLQDKDGAEKRTQMLLEIDKKYAVDSAHVAYIRQQDLLKIGKAIQDAQDQSDHNDKKIGMGAAQAGLFDQTYGIDKKYSSQIDSANDQLKDPNSNDDLKLQLNEKIDLLTKARDQEIDLANNSATYKKAIRDQELQGTSTLFGNLAVLSKSKNKELAAIGKASAIAQASIQTYLAATEAYASLASIPVVGPALGAVAAGAAIVAGLANVASIAGVGFETGGYTGGGGLKDVAGVVHGQEFVMNAENTAKYRSTLEAMNAGNFDPASLGQVKYADRGASKMESTMNRMNSTIIPDSQSSVASDLHNHIYNILDPKMLGDYMKTPEGERAFINTISRNATKISQVVRNA
jgi:tape measure domain-containing protein